MVLGILACDGRASNGALTVVQANYGSGTAQRDVTQQIVSQLRNGRLHLVVDGSLFGAAADSGKVQVLTVIYRTPEGQFTAAVLEGDLLELPPTSSADSSLVPVASSASAKKAAVDPAEPRRELQTKVDAAIQQVLGPLPTEPPGQVPLDNYEPSLMLLMEDIKDQQGNDSSDLQKYYSGLLHVCALLKEMAHERDGYIYRLNSNHKTASKSSLVTAAPVANAQVSRTRRVVRNACGTYNTYYYPSYHHERREAQERRNDEARTEELERRIHSHEASTLHQWKERSEKARRMISMHYSNSRALLRAQAGDTTP